MVKSGIVMDVQGKMALLMTSNGIFTKVKIKGVSPSIGEIYTGKVLRNLRLLNIDINLKLVLTAFFMILTSFGIFAYYIPTNETTLNVNSPIKLTTNYFDMVTNYDGNDETIEILNGVKIKNIPISESLTNILNSYKKSNIIDNEYLENKKSIYVNTKSLKNHSVDLRDFKSIIGTEKYDVKISTDGIYENTDLSEDSTNYNKLTENISTERSSNIKELRLNTSVKLKVDFVSKYPEYFKSSELASLLMMLKYAGINMDKQTILNEIPKDETQIELSENGTITQYGDPHEGLVGDINNNVNPYVGVYPEPLVGIINKYVNNSCVNISNGNFFDLTRQLDNGNPVMAWVTSNFVDPTSFNAMWRKGDRDVSFPYGIMNTIVLTGYDKDFIYYSDPSKENQKEESKIEISKFMEVWRKTGSYALSYNLDKNVMTEINNNTISEMLLVFGKTLFRF